MVCRWPLVGARSLVQLLYWCSALVLTSGGVQAADRVHGAWGPNGPWPLVPVHQVLLAEGRVLSYGSNPDGKQTGHLWYDVWDPRGGSIGAGHKLLPNTTKVDLFCSAQLVLPRSNNVLLLGGDNWIPSANATNNRGNNSSLIMHDQATPYLQKTGNMLLPRWYATPTVLPSGEIYIQGGKDGTAFPEIRSATGTFRKLNINTSALTYWYPRNFVTSKGLIFGISDLTMYYINPTGNGSLKIVGNLAAGMPSGVTTTDVMFAPGKILRTGGGTRSASDGPNGKASAVVIDITGATPVVKSTAAMPFGLHWHTGTVVPDGRVVVTGGSLKPNQLVGVNYNALIWDPKTGKWTVGAATVADQQHARLYHSNALLLSDASILVSGGGACPCAPFQNRNAQIYYPGYLYAASGAVAPRLRIVRAPTNITWGQSFELRVDRPLGAARITLIKTASVTHGFNFEQRFMQLNFTRSGDTLRVTAPANANLATPGKYLIFALDGSGVPSIGSVVSLP